jgi:hypothetical protein
MEKSIRAGILGSVLSVFIAVFIPYDLFFLPSLVASIVAIYVSKLIDLRDGLLAAFMTYFISGAVIEAIVAASFYVTSEPYTLVIDISIVVFPLVNVISAFLAAYIGVLLARRAKPAPELPQTLKPLPPV